MSFWYLSTDIGPVSRERAIALLDKGEACTVFDYPPNEEGRFLERDRRIEINPYEIEEDDGTLCGEFYFMLHPSPWPEQFYPETGQEAITAAEAYLSGERKAEADAEAAWAREKDTKARVVVLGTDID